MPVKPLNLDDRTFADLVDEQRLLIPRYAPPWTDHNVSDPGIMLVELFAWLTEALLYRINRVPDSSRMRLLDLLGATFRLAEPAVIQLRVHWSGNGSRTTLPRGARVEADWDSAQTVTFEVLHDVAFTSVQRVRTVRARQASRILSQVLPQASDGQKLQLFPLGDGFFVAPSRRQHRPRVFVAGEPWEYRPHLRQSPGDAKHFTYKPWLESIAFGDGQTGAVPPAGAAIEVIYHSTKRASDVVRDHFRSRGQLWQMVHLSQPLLPVDLEEPSELEPRLEVIDPDAPSLSSPWEYAASFLDMAEQAPQYVVEPWHNAIRFGNGGHGRIPAAGAKIRIAYHRTLGAAGNIPSRSTFSFFSRGQAAPGEESWTRADDLEVVDWEMLSAGRDATTLDEARSQVFALLAPGWRAVTADDFASIVQQNHPDVARVVCLPGYDPASPGPAANRPGHVGVIVIPRPSADLTLAASELHPVFSLAGDDLRLVAGDGEGGTWLWDAKAGQKMAQLASVPLHRLFLGLAGRRAVVAPQAGPAWLWDTQHGRQLMQLAPPPVPTPGTAAVDGTHKPATGAGDEPALKHAVFSFDGQRLATVAADSRVSLWESGDGLPLRTLGAVDPATPPVFSASGHLLAAALGDNAAALWTADPDQPSVQLQLDAQATALLFSPDETWLAVAAADATVRLARIQPAEGAILEERTLQTGQPVETMAFDASGTRLATLGSDGSAALWSSRTGARLADLSQHAPVEQLAWSRDGRWLAAAQRDHTVRCWNAGSGRATASLSAGAPVVTMLFSPSNSRRLVVVAVSAQESYALQVWDLHADSPRRVAAHDLLKSQPPVVHESGRWLAYTDERLVHVWDVEKGKDITAVYVDFDDPRVPMDGWRLLTEGDVPWRAAAAPGGLARETHGPTLWVASAAASSGTTWRTVQALNAQHIYQIDAMLAARKLVTSQHHVEGPAYTQVDISVQVVRRTLMTSQARVATDIKNALSRFFDPLHGGPQKSGWPLGRPVYASEVYEVVEGVPAVDHVEHLAMKAGDAGPTDRVDIPPQSLVNCEITVQVE